MEVLKFLLNLGMLSNHRSVEEIFDAESVGRSVIAGRVLSVSVTELQSGPLKCVGIMEEPPMNLPRQTKNFINIFLQNNFANIEFDIGILVAVNPESVSKSSAKVFQASLGFEEQNRGEIWIADSSRFTEEPNRYSHQNVPVEDCLKGECLCRMMSWYATPLLNDKTSSKTLKDVSCISLSSFNLFCKVLKVEQIRKDCSVIRVTDGTLYRWPVLFFNGHRVDIINLVNHERYFIDIIVIGIKDGFQAVKENMFIKLFGVEVRKFETASGVYHSFRTSGDPAKFKVLPQTHVMNRQIDMALKKLVKQERPRILENDKLAKLLKSGVAIHGSCSSSSILSDSAKISRRKLNKLSSSQGFLVDPELLSTMNYSCSNSESLKSERVITHVNITDTESKESTSVTKVPNVEGGCPSKITTLHETRNTKYRTDRALNKVPEYKRNKRLESDFPSTNRSDGCKLPKPDVTILARDRNSRIRTLSGLYESSIRRFLLDPGRQLTVDDRCGSKRQLTLNTQIKCKKPRQLRKDDQATNKTGGCKLPKSDVMFQPGENRRNSANISEKNTHSELHESSSSVEEFLVDPPLRDTCGSEQPLQSGNLVSNVKISGTESKDSTSVIKVHQFEGGWPTKTVPETHNMENRKDKAFNKFIDYKRRRKLENDCPGTNKSSDCKFPKTGDTIHTSGCIHSANMRSTDSGTQQVPQSASIVGLAKFVCMENKDRTSVTEVPNAECGCTVSDCEHTSKKYSDCDDGSLDLHISEDSDEDACVNPQCENYSCEIDNVYSLQISQLPFNSQ